MARRGSNGRTGKRPEEGQYALLPYAYLKSPAFRSLSGAAVKVFLELHTRFNGSNNGQVRLSMNEAMKALPLGKATVQRAFVELQDKGFLALTIPGNWYHRRAHEWRLTTKTTITAKGNQAATNDWRYWKPKTECGSVAEPSPLSMGPLQNPRPKSGSATEPVSATFGTGFGSETEH